MTTVEGRPHEAVYMCFEKNYADFFVSTFKTWFNWAIGDGRYLSLGRQLVQKRGKISNIDPD